MNIVFMQKKFDCEIDPENKRFGIALEQEVPFIDTGGTTGTQRVHSKLGIDLLHF